jgi:hypothetical protein
LEEHGRIDPRTLSPRITDFCVHDHDILNSILDALAEIVGECIAEML